MSEPKKSRACWGLISAQAWSWVLAIAGLVMIFLGIFKSEPTSYIAAASGIITELIAGVSFHVYNRTVRQFLIAYRDRLVDNNLLLVLELVQASTLRDLDRSAIIQKLTESLGRRHQSE